MRGHARLSVDGDGRVIHLVDSPPIAWRPTPEAVYVVGTAGGPTGDDEVRLDVDVAAGGCLRVRSTAATVVYRGRGTNHHVEATVGADAYLNWALEPVIVTAGAAHRQTAAVRMAPDAGVDWTELVVLGRHGEEPGRADLRLDCALASPDGSEGDDRPILRHQLRIGPGSASASAAVLAGRRAVGLRLLAGAAAPTAWPSPSLGEGWAWMSLDGPGWLLTAVAADLPELLERMAAAGA